MSDTYTVSYPVSATCRGSVGHAACGQSDAAWDVVLDGAADCTCRCHDDRPGAWTARELG